MTRTPACEDSSIGARLRELQQERLAHLAGCECPPDGDGGQTHRPGCLLEPRPAAMTATGCTCPPRAVKVGWHAWSCPLRPLLPPPHLGAIRRAKERLRLCTCAPSEAPRPCPHCYALTACWKAANARALSGAE